MCLFVCDRLLNNGTKCFHGLCRTDSRVSLVVKVVRLAVLCTFTFCFRVTLCKAPPYKWSWRLLTVLPYSNISLFLSITHRFVAKLRMQHLHDFVLHLLSWQNESVHCPRTLLQCSKHALQELSKAPGIIIKCYLRKNMLIVIMVQRWESQNTCFYFVSIKIRSIWIFAN